MSSEKLKDFDKAGVSYFNYERDARTSRTNNFITFVSMDRNKKLLLTKYILYKFYIWYEESFDNGKENDLSILKSLKLIFLLTTINVDKDGKNLLDMGFKFAAMPYGPVEIEIYDWHKSNTLNDVIDINGLNFSNLKNIANEKSISEDEKKIIDNNLEILKSKNYYLITKSAPYLIDLTHKFTSWKNNYREALKQKKFSQPIPDVDIKNDVFHYSL